MNALFGALLLMSLVCSICGVIAAYRKSMRNAVVFIAISVMAKVIHDLLGWWYSGTLP